MFGFKKKEIIKTDCWYSKYLPCGSIIKLNNDDDLYMIYRYLGNMCMSFKDTDISLCKSSVFNDTKLGDKKYYQVDYCICNYPIPKDSFYIRVSDIKEVIWSGYSDSMRMDILKDIDNWSKEVNEK